MPSQARFVKYYLSGTFACKIEDNKTTAAALGDSPKLSVKRAPAD
jgi:hypothetical protein